MLRGMIAHRITGFFDILILKNLDALCNASGKVATRFPVCARVPLFMRIAGRLPTGTDPQIHEKMTKSGNRSQTCRLQIAVERVTEGVFPPERSGGPIEGNKMVEDLSPPEFVSA